MSQLWSSLPVKEKDSIHRSSNVQRMTGLEALVDLVQRKHLGKVQRYFLNVRSNDTHFNPYELITVSEEEVRMTPTYLFSSRDNLSFPQGQFNWSLRLLCLRHLECHRQRQWCSILWTCRMVSSCQTLARMPSNSFLSKLSTHQTIPFVSSSRMKRTELISTFNSSFQMVGQHSLLSICSTSISTTRETSSPSDQQFHFPSGNSANTTRHLWISTYSIVTRPERVIRGGRRKQSESMDSFLETCCSLWVTFKDWSNERSTMHYHSLKPSLGTMRSFERCLSPPLSLSSHVKTIADLTRDNCAKKFHLLLRRLDDDASTLSVCSLPMFEQRQRKENLREQLRQIHRDMRWVKHGHHLVSSLFNCLVSHSRHLLPFLNLCSAMLASSLNQIQHDAFTQFHSSNVTFLTRLQFDPSDRQCHFSPSDPFDLLLLRHHLC